MTDAPERIGLKQTEGYAVNWYGVIAHVFDEYAVEYVRAADNEDGAPVEALRLIARDVDSLIDHGVTWAEMQDMRALYEGAKLAGLTGGQANE